MRGDEQINPTHISSAVRRLIACLKRGFRGSLPLRFGGPILKQCVDLSKKSIDFVQACCLSFLLACLPIVLFIPRYIDDYGRGVRGYYRWAQSGFRPLADWVYSAFNLGGPATAVAPLGQLASIPVSAMGALAISRVFQIGNPYVAVAATLPMYVNPYFLENLSYGFDALSMTAALTLAILAAAQVSRGGPWRQGVRITAGLLACLFLYQPAFGAYLPLALTAWLWQWKSKPHLADSRAAEAGSVIAMFAAPALSLIVYFISAQFFWLDRTSYGQKSSDLKAPWQLVMTIADSLSGYLQSLWRYWHDTAFLPIFLLLVIGFVVALTARLSRRMATAKSALLSLVTVVILVCIAPGPMYLLDAIDFVEVPRMNACIGGLFGSLALPLAGWASEQSCNKFCRVVGLVILATWAWCQLVFSYAYGHSVQAQREYEQGRLTRLIYDIRSLDPNRMAKTVRFEGSMPASPLLENTARKFPFMDRLVPRMINGPWPWGARQLGWLGLGLRPAGKDPASAADVLRSQACRNDATARCSSEHNIVLVGDSFIVKMK